MHALFLEFPPHRKGRSMETQPFVIGPNPACPDVSDLAEQLVQTLRVSAIRLLPDFSRRFGCQCPCRDLIKCQEAVRRSAGSEGRGGDMADGMKVIMNTGIAQRTENSPAAFAFLSSGRSTANLHLVSQRKEDPGARGGLSVVGGLRRQSFPCR